MESKPYGLFVRFFINGTLDALLVPQITPKMYQTKPKNQVFHAIFVLKDSLGCSYTKRELKKKYAN